MITRGFVGIAIIMLAAASTATAAPQTEYRRPNLIFIMADDLGYGDLGCYGQERIATPNLDRMAREGRRFTQFYSGSTVCAPARCCLMTGRHSGRAWIRGNGRDPLRPEDVTVAEVLREAGYATAIVGKWGLGEAGSTGIPNRQGFEEWFGYLNQRHAHNFYPEYLWDNEDKVRLANEVPGPGGPAGGVATVRGDYSHDLFTFRALEFLERRRDQPFFLYLPYTIPHANNEARNKGMEVPHPGIYAHEPWPEPQRHHAAMITRLDRDIGRLLSKLQELGITEDTIVLFTSDNGPHSEGGAKSEFFDSNGPLRGMKRNLTEGGIRVPLIAWGPGRVEAGSESDVVWAFWDILPTFASLAGTRVQAQIDGLDFSAALTDRGTVPTHDCLYWAFYERGGSQAIRMGPWKAIAKPASAPVKLYHLGWDVGETTDLAAAYPEIAEKLREEMSRQYAASDRWKFAKAP